MKQFNIEAQVTEHFFVDAEDVDEATAIAEKWVIEGFEVLPHQVTITNVKEI